MADYTKSEYKKVQKKFEEEWLPTTLQRIHYLKEYVGEEIAEKLDFSKESLVLVSQLIIDTFEHKSLTWIPENKPLLDAISTYIGEVYIKYGKGLVKWVAFDRKPEENEYYFEGLLIFANGNGKYVPSNYPFVIYNKSLDKISEVFTNFIGMYVEDYQPIVPMPGRGGYAYQYFILLKEETFGLKDIEKNIQAYIDKFSKPYIVSYFNENHLLLKITEDYYFHFSYDATEGLDDESKSIANSYKGNKDKSVISSCKTRIEFWGDEDNNGEFLNVHMSILDLIISNEKIFIYDFRNKIFYDEF